jgi:hypothetical protein
MSVSTEVDHILVLKRNLSQSDGGHNIKDNQMEPEQPIKLFAIQSKNEKSGFYLAWVPSELDENQLQSAFNELGIEPEQTMEVGGWRTSSENVAVAFVPFPPHVHLLEPSRS